MKRKAIPVKVRKFVMERDEHKCTRCGITEELVIHHELPVCEGGGVEPENLKVLCMACHKAVHVERGDDYAMDMASTRYGMQRGEPDHSWKRMELSVATADLVRDFGVSEDQAHILGVLYGWNDGYPNLLNIAKNVGMDELKLATAFISLIDRELILVTRVPQGSNLYRMNRSRYDKYFGQRITYYDERKNVVGTTERGRFFFIATPPA